MSLHLVRAALETALATLSPAIATVHENTPYTPVAGTPYQQVYLLAADPENLEMNAAWTERGIFQVNLFYPLSTGPADATARAEMIRALFARGATFSAGGITTLIQNTPSIGPGRIEEDRYFLPVKTRFSAQIRS